MAKFTISTRRETAIKWDVVIVDAPTAELAMRRARIESMPDSARCPCNSDWRAGAGFSFVYHVPAAAGRRFAEWDIQMIDANRIGETVGSAHEPAVTIGRAKKLAREIVAHVETGSPRPEGFRFMNETDRERGYLQIAVYE